MHRIIQAALDMRHGTESVHLFDFRYLNRPSTWRLCWVKDPMINSYVYLNIAGDVRQQLINNKVFKYPLPTTSCLIDISPTYIELQFYVFARHMPAVKELYEVQAAIHNRFMQQLLLRQMRVKPEQISPVFSVIEDTKDGLPRVVANLGTHKEALMAPLDADYPAPYVMAYKFPRKEDTTLSIQPHVVPDFRISDKAVGITTPYQTVSPIKELSVCDLSLLW